MNDLEIFEHDDFGEVRVKIVDGEPQWVAKDVCRALNIKNYRDSISGLDEDEKMKTKIETNGGKQKMTAINKEGVKRIILSSRKPEAKVLAREIGLGMITTKEQDTLEIVINSIEGIVDYETQFSVGEYRIDLYLPNLKIAIECDENGHSDRELEQEFKRQNFIKQQLNCEFIRFNPDDDNFNIGKVINQILKEVL